MNEFRDSIEREIVIQAPIERVWSAITDPEEVRQWFGDQSQYELREGAEGVFKWEGNSNRMKIMALEPPHRFVYRWVMPQFDDLTRSFDEMPTTQVEYVLETIPEGTRLNLTESGFGNLPADKRDKHFAENSQGWTEELGQLVTYVERVAVS